MKALKLLTFVATFIFALQSSTEISLPSILPYCDETVEEFAPDEPTPLGFSGLDVVNLSKNISHLKIVFAYKEETTMGEIRVEALPEPVRYVKSVAVYPKDWADFEITCDDRLEMGVNVKLDSVDGSFHDQWQAGLVSRVNDCTDVEGACFSAGEYAELFFGVETDSMKGSFYRDLKNDHRDFLFEGSFSPAGFKASSSYVECVADNDSRTCSQVNTARLESMEGRD